MYMAKGGTRLLGSIVHQRERGEDGGQVGGSCHNLIVQVLYLVWYLSTLFPVQVLLSLLPTWAKKRGGVLTSRRVVSHVRCSKSPNVRRRHRPPPAKNFFYIFLFLDKTILLKTNISSPLSHPLNLEK
jgi:hypothetical protein